MTFRVFAPTATAVRVVVADEVEGSAGQVDHEMRRGDGGVWEATVDGDLAGGLFPNLVRVLPPMQLAALLATTRLGEHAGFFAGALETTQREIKWFVVLYFY